MKAVSLNSSRPLGDTPKAGIFDKLAQRIVLRKLETLQHGQLVIRDGSEEQVFGQVSSAADLSACITVNDPRFYGEIAFGGSCGAGEAWMDGYWDCDDLVGLVRLMVRNRAVLEVMDTGIGRLTRPLQRLLHRAHRNTRRGAQRNIAAHYDLGNEFFALWLDESMMYSCAIFEHEEATLAEAQRARLDRVCQRLDLRADDHLVEIGTGWGALAMHAARHYGCRVTTTTISSQQFKLAKQRIDEAGLGNRITLLLEDYRDLTGEFDKLVSLEMIEAIGSAQYDTYFAKCRELLNPGGRMLIQAITIEDERFEQYSRNTDFIQRHIFPGSCLPSEKVMRETIGRVTDMTISSVEEIGLHYATTLKSLAAQFFRQAGRGPRYRLSGAVHPHVGVLYVLLRRRVPGALDR